jgi:hypothetical protein
MAATISARELEVARLGSLVVFSGDEMRLAGHTDTTPEIAPQPQHRGGRVDVGCRGRLKAPAPTICSTPSPVRAASGGRR